MSERPSTVYLCWEQRRRVMARVGHLIPRKQQEIERAVRLLRIHFVDRRRRSPRRGTLHQIMLIGPYARRGEKSDRETGEINKYEIWAFVDHPAYKGKNRYWGLARHVVAANLRGRASIILSVFTIDEIDRVRAAGNRFLTDKYDGGVVLYDSSDDEAYETDHGGQ
jgi:hypothetical protein